MSDEGGDQSNQIGGGATGESAVPRDLRWRGSEEEGKNLCQVKKWGNKRSMVGTGEQEIRISSRKEEKKRPPKTASGHQQAKKGIKGHKTGHLRGTNTEGEVQHAKKKHTGPKWLEKWGYTSSDWQGSNATNI